MPPVDHLRLSELNGKIKNAIDHAFARQTYWVIADITNHTHKQQTNYHYFELVEKDPLSSNLLAKIPAASFGSGSLAVTRFEEVTGQRFTNNIHVRVNVSVDFHSIYGLKLVLNDIDSNFTMGMLAQQREATLSRLVTENPAFISKVGDRYITLNNQLQLPLVIQRIALVSSRNSAGAEDFRHTLDNNPYGYAFIADDYFTSVQGESNARDLIGKIIEIFSAGIKYDAVVITRGGGSQTDFLIFDNYLIGKAIAKFPIPIITGIGHQKNETIADLMAHTQVKTPTKAAEFIIANNRGYEEAIMAFQRSIINNVKHILLLQNERLLRIKANPLAYLKIQKNNLENFKKLFRAVSPENILKRGFAIVKSNDKIIRNARHIKAGEKIDIILSDTVIHSTVNKKERYNGRDFNV